MKTKRISFKEDFLDAKLKRNWITSQLPKLTYEQINRLSSIISRWLKEEESR